MGTGRGLYVGKLACAVTAQDLRDLFAEAGNVENSRVIVDREADRSSGFGFVEIVLVALYCFALIGGLRTFRILEVDAIKPVHTKNAIGSAIGGEAITDGLKREVNRGCDLNYKSWAPHQDRRTSDTEILRRRYWRRPRNANDQ
jgi:hypothetical protein